MAPDEHHYGTQDYAGDRATQTQRSMRHLPGEDRVDRADLQDSITGRQAAHLVPEVRMGDDRVLGDAPNWEGFDSEQLHAFATQGNDPSSADGLGRVFNTGGNSLAEAANGLLDAVTRLDGAWSGVAADSARSALAPLAEAAGQAGQTAQMMGVQMSRQSLAASEVRKLPPAQKFDQKQSLQAMLAGGPAAMQADLKAQKESSDAVKREQVAYLNAYTSAMSAVDERTPSFVPPPQGSIDPGRSGGPVVSGGTVAYSSRLGGFESAGVTGTPSTHVTDTGTGTGTGSGSGSGTAGGGDLTPAGGLPSAGTGAAGFVPGASAPVSSPAASAAGVGSTAPGAGSFGSGFGDLGGAASGGAVSGRGTSGGLGAGQSGERTRGGAGPAAVAGPVGRGGAAGTPVTGRRQDEEEDEERKRPTFLLADDSDATFGSDQLAAPTVIGMPEDD
jgi:hypothetical protein